MAKKINQRNIKNVVKEIDKWETVPITLANDEEYEYKVKVDSLLPSQIEEFRTNLGIVFRDYTERILKEQKDGGSQESVSTNVVDTLITGIIIKSLTDLEIPLDAEKMQDTLMTLLDINALNHIIARLDEGLVEELSDVGVRYMEDLNKAMDNISKQNELAEEEDVEPQEGDNVVDIKPKKS